MFFGFFMSYTPLLMCVCVCVLEHSYISKINPTISWRGIFSDLFLDSVTTVG